MEYSTNTWKNVLRPGETVQNVTEKIKTRSLNIILLTPVIARTVHEHHAHPPKKSSSFRPNEPTSALYPNPISDMSAPYFLHRKVPLHGENIETVWRQYGDAPSRALVTLSVFVLYQRATFFYSGELWLNMAFSWFIRHSDSPPCLFLGLSSRLYCACET